MNIVAGVCACMIALSSLFITPVSAAESLSDSSSINFAEPHVYFRDDGNGEFIIASGYTRDLDLSKLYDVRIAFNIYESRFGDWPDLNGNYEFEVSGSITGVDLSSSVVSCSLICDYDDKQYFEVSSFECLFDGSYFSITGVISGEYSEAFSLEFIFDNCSVVSRNMECSSLSNSFSFFKPILPGVNSIFNFFTLQMSDLVSTLFAKGNELLLLPIIIFIVGAVIGLCKRLVGR